LIDFFQTPDLTITLCNFLLALPFIGLGYALLTNKSFVLLFIAILAGGYVLTFWLKRKFTDEA